MQSFSSNLPVNLDWPASCQCGHDKSWPQLLEKHATVLKAPSLRELAPPQAVAEGVDYAIVLQQPPRQFGLTRFLPMRTRQVVSLQNQPKVIPMKTSKLLSVVLSVLTALVVLTGSIAVPLLCRPFYYAHIGPLAWRSTT